MFENGNQQEEQSDPKASIALNNAIALMFLVILFQPNEQLSVD